MGKKRYEVSWLLGLCQCRRRYSEKDDFYETELDPATNWKQTWQNQDSDSPVKGYVDLDAALISAAALLANVENRSLMQSDLDKAVRYEPIWQTDDCEIRSLSHLLGSQTA
jgi:hypothetical protein